MQKVLYSEGILPVGYASHKFTQFTDAYCIYLKTKYSIPSTAQQIWILEKAGSK